MRTDVLGKLLSKLLQRGIDPSAYARMEAFFSVRRGGPAAGAQEPACRCGFGDDRAVAAGADRARGGAARTAPSRLSIGRDSDLQGEIGMREPRKLRLMKAQRYSASSNWPCLGRSADKLVRAVLAFGWFRLGVALDLTAPLCL